MEGHGNNLNDIFGASLRRSNNKSRSDDDDGGVISLLSPENSPTKAGTRTPVKAKSAAKAAAALSPRRMPTADANTNDIISISSSPVDPYSQFSTAAASTAAASHQDDDDNNDIMGHHAFDIKGHRPTLVHLIEDGHIAVATHAPFQKHSVDLQEEMAHLVKKGLFSTKGRCGVGKGDTAKRGPVYISTFDSNNPGLVKKFLTENQGRLCLGFIEFWEDICDKNDLVISDIYFANYRTEESLTKEEWNKHHTLEGHIPCGYMVDHGDTYGDGVITRVTATMFEKMVKGKVQKRFRVSNKSVNGEPNYDEVSFIARNGTTVIMDSHGSGNTSDWKHGVEGAEGTYTITLQLRKKTTTVDTDSEEDCNKKMPAKKSLGMKSSTAAAVSNPRAGPMAGRKGDVVDLTSDSD